MFYPRLADILITTPGLTLGAFGYETDRTPAEREGNAIRFYHYTHPEHLAAILDPDGGLRPRRTTPFPPAPEFPWILEGLLGLSPTWLTRNRYFTDLGAELFQQHIGPIPLVVTVPGDFPGLWVVDYAPALECKHVTRREFAPLGLGFDCSTGRECVRALENSRIPLASYVGGHIAPIVECSAATPDIAISSRFIDLA